MRKKSSEKDLFTIRHGRTEAEIADLRDLEHLAIMPEVTENLTDEQVDALPITRDKDAIDLLMNDTSGASVYIGRGVGTDGRIIMFEVFRELRDDDRDVNFDLWSMHDIKDWQNDP